MKEYKYTINGNKYEVTVGDITDSIATLFVNGEEFKVEIEHEPEPVKKPVVRPVVVSSDSNVSTSTESKSSVNKANSVKAPLPGVITDILVAEGDEVEAGQNVIVLEAMKMANNLQAEKSGKVTAICVKIGENVMEDDALIVIE